MLRNTEAEDQHPSSSPPDGTVAPIKATQRMGVPEAVRLLRIAIPTPMQPIAPLPSMAPLLPVSAIVPSPPPRPLVRSRLEEARNAIALFFALLGSGGLLTCLVALTLFR